MAKKLAQRSGVSKAEAADQIDRVVNQILASLRNGQTAPLPGLGRFVPGRSWEFRFDGRSEKAKERDK
jgi:nucleoid DNA-binding protein